jgi:hypothetical protein
MPIECCDVKKKREKDQEQLRTEMTSSLDGRNGTRGRVLENLTLCLFSNSQPPGIGMRRAELLMTVLLRSEVSVRRELYYMSSLRHYNDRRRRRPIERQHRQPQHSY